MARYAAESDRLWLELLNVEDHLEDYHTVMTEPKCLAWSRSSPHKSLNETHDLILRTQPSTNDPWKRVYAILLRPLPAEGPDTNSTSNLPSKPRMIGTVGTPREDELAYKLHPSFWKHGYMSEAFSLFLPLFFTLNPASNTLRALADPENTASTNVLQRAGFQKSILLKSMIVRSCNEATGKRSDLQCFWLPRPGTEEDIRDEDRMGERTGSLGVNSEHHQQVRESVKSMLAP